MASSPSSIVPEMGERTAFEYMRPIGPRTLCVVTPSERRIWDTSPEFPVRARRTYTGGFSRKCQSYAERFYRGHWCILDPCNGFMWPDEVIRRPHDRCLYRPETQPLTADQLREHSIRRKLDDFDAIIALGGMRFILLMEEVFPGKRVRAPLAGIGGIGEMMKALDDAIGTGRRL
jgi:hypothetical protein